jgi:hypothetical protein
LGVFDRLLTVLRNYARAKTFCIFARQRQNDMYMRERDPTFCTAIIASTGDLPDYAKATSNDAMMNACFKIDIGGRSYKFRVAPFEVFRNRIKLFLSRQI